MQIRINGKYILETNKCCKFTAKKLSFRSIIFRCLPITIYMCSNIKTSKSPRQNRFCEMIQIH